jgi:hypothetical protein
MSQNPPVLGLGKAVKNPLFTLKILEKIRFNEAGSKV